MSETSVPKDFIHDLGFANHVLSIPNRVLYRVVCQCYRPVTLGDAVALSRASRSSCRYSFSTRSDAVFLRIASGLCTTRRTGLIVLLAAVWNTCLSRFSCLLLFSNSSSSGPSACESCAAEVRGCPSSISELKLRLPSICETMSLYLMHQSVLEF